MNALARSTLLSVLLSGCVGAPSPLAPSLTGSVGVPHLGAQTDAIEFPITGLGFVRYRPHGQHYWGRPNLVKLVSDAAARVAEQTAGGPPLVVGDFSARFGGKIQGRP